jgi:curved DNA-binding protein CbpA
MSADPYKTRIDQVYADLDRYTYYELLNLTPQAGPDDIRAAFHRAALSMHPDRFHNHPDASLREKLYVIYKRITEGYKVLSDSQDRREYDEGLARGQLRLVRVEKKKGGPPRPAAGIDNPAARRFFDLALAAERRNDFKTARLNYKFAADLLGGDHPAIAERLAHMDRDDKGK